METFWNTIASYNAATWPAQLALTLAAVVLTLLLYFRPSPAVRIAMKVFMALLNFWIAGVYYLVCCEPREHHGLLALSVPGADAADTYRYDPDDPAVNIIDMSENEIEVPEDYAAEELRPDVLCYTTPPLAADAVITGDCSVELFISSDAEDTDFIVRVTEATPDGKSIKLADGVLCAKYREGSPLSAAGRRISHPYPHHKILQTLREGQPPAGHRYLQCQKFPVSQQQHAGGLQQCGDRGRPQHHPSRPDASLRHHAERRKGIGILSPAAFLLIFPFFDRILHGLPGQTAL